MQVDPYARPPHGFRRLRPPLDLVGPGKGGQIHAGPAQKTVIYDRTAVYFQKPERPVPWIKLVFRNRDAPEPQPAEQFDTRLPQQGIVRHYFRNTGNSKKGRALADLPHQ